MNRANIGKRQISIGPMYIPEDMVRHVKENQIPKPFIQTEYVQLRYGELSLRVQRLLGYHPAVIYPKMQVAISGIL